MRIARTFLLTAAICLFASSTSAIPPTVVVEQINIEGSLGDCGGFEILRTAPYTITQTIFFDAEGNVSRITIRWDGTETFSNSVTGYSLAGMPFRGLLVITPEGEQLTRGFLLGGHVPGLGMVLLNAGNVTFDLTTEPFTITFEHGTFDNLFFSDDPPQIERLCLALSMSAKPTSQDTTWGVVKRLYR